MKKTKFLLICIVVMCVVGCKKEHPPVEDTSYKCECGNLTWKGVSYPLSFAEVVSQGDSTLDRSYYISADIGLEEDDFSHHININFSMSDLTDEVFFADIDSNAIAINIEEVNREFEVPLITEYQAELGIINVTSSLVAGGSEKVNFNLQCRQFQNNIAVGEPISLIGNLEATR